MVLIQFCASILDTNEQSNNQIFEEIQMWIQSQKELQVNKDNRDRWEFQKLSLISLEAE